MRKIFFLASIMYSCAVAGQDLNGIWQGTLTQGPGGCFPQYHIELQINFIITANTLSGKAYDYFDKSRYVKLDFIGRYNSTTKRMVIIENDLMESHIPDNCVPCIKTYDLSWSRSGNEEVLIGECKGRQFGSGINDCPAYKIILKRVAKSDFVVDIDQNKDLQELQKNLRL